MGLMKGGITMIDEYSLEAKGFSIELPRFSARLTAISESLQNGYEGADPINNEVMKDIGYCLEDIRDELDVINKALCTLKASSEPDTTPISDEIG
jgi:hypothetical protein